MEARGVHNTGSFGQGGPIATAGGLIFIAGTIDKRFRAFYARTGKYYGTPISTRKDTPTR
jgi:quinoprotein glucose dehydrogenase